MTHRRTPDEPSKPISRKLTRGEKGKIAYATLSEPIAERERLELRWRDRIRHEPRFATMVTARTAAHEPYHRWLHYKQGFSPALVRAFLAEQKLVGPIDRPKSRLKAVLDPFAGSGTTLIECARHAIPAVGVERIPALVFLTNTALSVNLATCGSLPPIADTELDWHAVAPRMTQPIQQAALMLAVSRQYTTAGRLNRGAKPLPALLRNIWEVICADLRHPLVSTLRHYIVPGSTAPCLVGDARRMDALPDRFAGAILTSPPYLSRHNYSQINKPIQIVHSFWYPKAEAPMTTTHVPVTTLTHSADSQELHPAIEEAADALRRKGEDRLARQVGEYFAGMLAMLRECRRILVEGALAWLVIGGTRLKDVYIPSDLILADLTLHCGFRVEEIRVARNLVGSPRKLGAAGHLAPRESILVLRS